METALCSVTQPELLYRSGDAAEAYHIADDPAEANDNDQAIQPKPIVKHTDPAAAYHIDQMIQPKPIVTPKREYSHRKLIQPKLTDLT